MGSLLSSQRLQKGFENEQEEQPNKSFKQDAPKSARLLTAAFGIMKESIPHPASEAIASADVISFRYEGGSESDESTLELAVVSKGVMKRFRFFSPQQLRVGGTFPQIGFLQIMDIEDRQFDRLKVLVLDGEQNESIWFYARDIEILPP